MTTGAIVGAAEAYRSRPRAVALLIGSAGEARAAIRRAMVRTAAGLAVSAAALVAHGWAAGEGGVIAYGELRCKQGSADGCAVAGALLARNLEDSKEASVVPPRDLLRRACARGSREGCADLSRLIELLPTLGYANEELQAAQTACISGDTERCRAVAARLRLHQPAEAATFARIGCGYRDAESCEAAMVLGERAAQPPAWRVGR